MSINDTGLNIVENNKNNLSIYVHIPFCNSKCAYCSFVSVVGSDEEKKRYFDNLVTEIKLQSKNYRQFYSVGSIYIGGGTPSCLDYYFIRDLLSSIYKNFSVKNTAEITIELNPGTIDKNKVREYILSGVNRFSVGLQSINPKILRAMGRTHTPEDFDKAISTIREFGIKNISSDMIIGYPKQTLTDVKETLMYLIEKDVPHISIYMLQVEEGTALKKMVDNNSVALPEEDLVIKMYNYVSEVLAEKGYARYELSNFAKFGYESYHNKVYWNRKDYLGLGLAAHSYINGTRFSNTENLAEYTEMLETKETLPTIMSKTLSTEEMKEEAIMLSLRTAEGLNLESYTAEFGENFLAKKKSLIAKLIESGFLKLTNNHLVCTQKGYLVLNQIVLQLCS